MGEKRVEVSGHSYNCVNNDCTEELHGMAADSAHLIVTSIPFGTQYEYSASYNDFGHADDQEHLWAEMDFLTPPPLRALQPGRIGAFHVKECVATGHLNRRVLQTFNRESTHLSTPLKYAHLMS